MKHYKTLFLGCAAALVILLSMACAGQSTPDQQAAPTTTSEAPAQTAPADPAAAPADGTAPAPAPEQAPAQGEQPPQN